MIHWLARTEMLIGKHNIQKMEKSSVAIFGVGGVGSFVVEALARAGLGNFMIVDDDKVCITNLNRQLHATTKTLGKYKVDAMKERILEINPKANVCAVRKFYLPGEDDNIISSEFNYIVDAVDTVSAKIGLVVRANELNIPIISSMGTGNKIDPKMLTVTDIYKTKTDPLARVMRKELKARGIKKLKVVYSEEQPIKVKNNLENTACLENCACPPGVERTCSTRRSIPASISFVPACAGLIIAGEVVRDLLGGLGDDNR